MQAAIARLDRATNGAIRSRAGLQYGKGLQGAGVEQRDAGIPAVGYQDLSVVGDGARRGRKSGQCRKVAASIVVDYLDAAARRVRNEDAPAFCVERAVIEGAARGAWYGDGADRFQRHDSPLAFGARGLVRSGQLADVTV